MPTFSEFVGALSVDTIGGSEKVPLVDGSTNKYVTVTLVAEFVIDQLINAAEVTPTTGDTLFMDRSGTEGKVDLDDLADYAIAKAFDSTVGDSIVSGDLVVIER